MQTLSSIQFFKITALILFIIFLFSLAPQNSKTISSGLPFGGKITSIWPFCNVTGGNKLIFGEFHNTNILSHYSSAKAYNYGPPKLIGQNLLGKATAPTPCIHSWSRFDYVNYGTAPNILFNGSSKSAGV